MIRIDNLCKQYVLKSGVVHALDNLTMELPERGMVFILGKSGCGKSTLLNILGGIDTATSGDMTVDGKSIGKLSGKELDNYRREKIGFVFQEYNLIDEYSVYGNLSIALELLGEKNVRKRVNVALDKVELAEYGVRKTSELSGGQKQRVAIARAIVKNPAIILADEPTGNLDSKTSKGIMELLRTIANEKLVVVVTHDSVSAAKYGDRIIEIVDGEIGSDTINRPQLDVSLQNSPIDTTEVVADNHKNISESAIVDSASEIVVLDEHECDKGRDRTIKIKKMSIGRLTKLSFINIWKKKFRLIITMVLFVFSLTLFGIGISALSFDVDKVAYNTYKQQGIEDLRVQKRVEPENLAPHDILFSNEEVTNFVNKHSEYQFDYTYAYKDYRYFSEISEDERMSIYIPDGMMLLDDDVLLKNGYKMTAGTLPSSDKEFCISRITADKLIEFMQIETVDSYEKMIGEVIKFNQYGDMVIVGILDTGIQLVIDKIYTSKASYIHYDARLRDTIKYSYNSSILVNAEFINSRMYERSNNFGSFDYKTKGVFGMNARVGQGMLCSEKYAQEFRGTAYDTIVYANGISSLGKNEIILEKHIVEALAVTHNGGNKVTEEQILEFLDTKPTIPNFKLYNSSQGGGYSYVTATIAGYHDFADPLNIPIFWEPIIITDNDMFKREMNDINIMSMHTKLIGNAKKDKAIMKDLASSGYYSPSYVMGDLEDAAHNTLVFKTLGMAIAFAFAIFSALMMFNFISASIKTNKKQVGVLRAIGMSTGKVSFIFLFESIIICMLSFIFSVICAIPIASVLSVLSNSYVVPLMSFVIDFPVAIAMLGLSIFVGVIGSLVPVWRKARVSPVKLIRD